jgi:hypothetical protein
MRLSKSLVAPSASPGRLVIRAQSLQGRMCGMTWIEMPLPLILRRSAGAGRAIVGTVLFGEWGSRTAWERP